MSRARAFAASLPLLLSAAFVLGGCLKQEEPTPSGAEDFAAYCSACHGADGTGRGAMASELGKAPADLTKLAGKDGKIPMARVMSKIWGYTRTPEGDLMPQFAPLLEADNMVLFDSGDGIPTPTPLRLVQLAEHLQSIQAR